MVRKVLLLVAVLALVAAACGDDAASDTTIAPPTTAAPTTTTTAAPAAATIVLASSALGEIVTDQDGNTLYLFTPDTQGPSVCNDGCAEAWPPLVSGSVAGDGVDGALLGTATRDDGAVQVTYNGWPLYYFAADAQAGDTNGQGVNDVWYVVSAAGEAIGLAEMEVALTVTSSSLGDIVTDQDGNTLYLLLPDAQGPSGCNDGCAAAWPPLVGGAVAGDGADAALVGAATRDDGAEQVTYNGWPLYYFASDSQAGDTNGQGANDVWFVVSAVGEAIGLP